jgi:putative heme iron utilization protein
VSNWWQHEDRTLVAMTDHGYTSGGPPPGIAGDTSSFPTDAEYARSLAHAQGRASLSTLTAQGYPFGSVVSYVCTSLGEPVVCISSMAEHTINARNDQRASVLIAEPVPAGADPLASARLTLVGDLIEYGRVTDDLRMAFLERHPSARFYVDYTDFSWWRLVPTAVRFVGGFGHMSWVGVPEYTAAEPDPLGHAADGICQHMNDDHRSANLMYAQVLAGLSDATDAAMSAVDRYGFVLDVTTPAGGRQARIAFAEPVSTGEQVRAAVVALLADCRSRQATPGSTQSIS